MSRIVDKRNLIKITRKRASPRYSRRNQSKGREGERRSEGRGCFFFRIGRTDADDDCDSTMAAASEQGWWRRPRQRDTNGEEGGREGSIRAAAAEGHSRMYGRKAATVPTLPSALNDKRWRSQGTARVAKRHGATFWGHIRVGQADGGGGSNNLTLGRGKQFGDTLP